MPQILQEETKHVNREKSRRGEVRFVKEKEKGGYVVRHVEKEVVLARNEVVMQTPHS